MERMAAIMHYIYESWTSPSLGKSSSLHHFQIAKRYVRTRVTLKNRRTLVSRDGTPEENVSFSVQYFQSR